VHRILVIERLAANRYQPINDTRELSPDKSLYIILQKRGETQPPTSPRAT
jgi:hypothetical protein